MDGVSVITMKLTGARGVVQQLKSYQNLYPEATTTALYQKGLQIIGEAVKLVPVDYGRLRGSHYVTEPTRAAKPVVELGFGTDYGIYVHERDELRHKVGQSNFLGEVFDKAKGTYARDMLMLVRKNAMRGIVLSSISSDVPTKPEESSD